MEPDLLKHLKRMKFLVCVCVCVILKSMYVCAPCVCVHGMYVYKCMYVCAHFSV